jgi:hypothetical protein
MGLSQEDRVTIKRWMYRNGRPNRLAKVLNSFWAQLHAKVAPQHPVFRLRQTAELVQ